MATCSLFLNIVPALAGASAYDLSVLLDEPHPLARPAPSPSTGWYQPVAPAFIHAPARIPPRPAPPRRAARATPQPRVAEGVLSSGDGTIGQRRWLGGFLSEIRFGALVHDEGLLTRNEEDGFDGNLELLFVSPDFLRVLGSPRPHLGASLNANGNTHQGYFGLSWEWTLWRGLFAGFSAGGTVHSGHLSSTRQDRKELGCRVLFRISVELGYRFAARHGLSAFTDHASNANLCDFNEGLDSFGIRYGYLF